MEVIFSKRLTDTDVTHRLAIPTGSFGEFGQIPVGENRKEFKTVDNTGRSWTFCVSTRKKGSYSKPVLAGKGWLPFVEEKGLREGDEVTFLRERNEANGARFRIQVRRKIVLWGQEIEGEV